ncbi:uncharacterized protein Eint_040300 [Encephalitozoon intestinalis ATCC 50506]|uniref:Uncharacterized protein n=1 Tax=Encephalitozoon intestinalis (strain ATCC 50506) TaxID=876142 RepID=E0S6I6_ENCIT|nr:uncharacterized protein Eint_040300 [Encephalitozoon intestinalis ATCC 50506]ADM11321.1 hypothetical protein Eint_040300 [Encephalitozoon intestinalis ATCC 50506]UTX45007.1 hypothetical protein GPK93_04g05420 [Encephalitozoon intestinalis]
MSILQNDIDAIIRRYKGLQIREKEYKDIVGTLVGGTLEKAPHPKIIELIEIFVSAKTKPIYLNEVKNYLFENDKDLYRRYAGMFERNPGVFEAFGIQGEERVLPLPQDEPVVFKSLKPKLADFAKRKSKTLRKTIRKESKMSAYHKVMKEKSASIEYQKKIDAMYRKARKE